MSDNSVGFGRAVRSASLGTGLLSILLLVGAAEVLGTIIVVSISMLGTVGMHLLGAGSELLGPMRTEASNITTCSYRIC